MRSLFLTGEAAIAGSVNIVENYLLTDTSRGRRVALKIVRRVDGENILMKRELTLCRLDGRDPVGKGNLMIKRPAGAVKDVEFLIPEPGMQIFRHAGRMGASKHDRRME